MNNRIIKNLTGFFRVPWMSILLGVLFLALVLSILQPSFSSLTNFRNILLQSSFTAIIAVGMTFVLLIGGIDISVGMNVFLMMAVMCELGKILPAPLVFIVGIAGGTLIGIINGFLICILDIVPLIATLSTLAVCRGLAYLIIESKMRVASDAIRVIGLSKVFGVIPLPIIIMIGVTIAGYFLLKNTRFGRYVLAVGNSTLSAEESGINVNKVRFGTYALCGLCTGIAALIYVGRLGIVQTDTAYGIEFTVITAVVLGGTKLSGGRGNIIGSVIGCVFLILIENGLSLMEVSGFYYDVVRGAILFIAVVIETLSSARQKKFVTRERFQRLRMKPQE